MLELLGQWLFVTISNCIIDVIVFILIDIVVKRVIEDASTEDEKQKIWLGESLLLFVVGILVYYLYHVPVLLFMLALVTFIYTQILKGMPVREYCRSWMTSWEDHLYHSANMRLIQRQQKSLKSLEAWRKQTMSAIPPASKPVLQKISDLVFRKAPASNLNSDQAKTPDLSMNKLVSQDQIHMNSYPSTTSPQYSPVLQKPAPAPVSTAPLQIQNTLSIQPQEKINRNNWFGRTDLKRRPLHSIRNYYTGPVNLSEQTQNIRNKFMSAFGYRSARSKPSGIRNEGQNLCFINSILQCLAHTPTLAQVLSGARKEEMDCSVAESQLLDTLSDLLNQCCRSKASYSVLDTTDFRQCAALLTRQGLVAPLTERQLQQDAAEFYTSLIETVHSILNKTVKKGKKPSNQSLSTLRFIYADLRPENIDQLKEACKKEISEANGLNNESYAEPIQRLADLEWLSHKQKNQTVLDDIFTGQLVSATHCLTDNHLTVSTQAFNILPVPIVSPRDLSGLVYLEDCFTKYCNIEHLVGKDGIDCSVCNKTGILNSGTSQPGINPRKTRSSSTRGSRLNSHTVGNIDSGMQSPRIPSASSYMSPILGNRDNLNDSGFHDNVFRTSTPVSDTNCMFPPPLRLRDAERRCLLRQLPECLVIQLMRFTYNQFSQQPRKILASVSIPLKGFDLKSVVFDNVTNRPSLVESEQKYNLYAVCVHLGGESTHSGHYVCYCQSDNGVWYKFDDDLVWDVNMEYEVTTKEIRENAYLLFYKRTK